MTTRTLRKHFPELLPAEASNLSDLMQAGTHEGIDTALDTANDYLGGYGVEALRDTEWTNYYLDIGVLYVNLGDPYYKTLMYDTRTGRYIAAAWGDYIDTRANRKRFAEA